MKNHLQFTKTDLVPRPVKGKVNLFVDRYGFLKSVDDTEAPKAVGDSGPQGPAGQSITIEYLTLAEYTALTVEQQNDPQVWYMITDEA